MKEAFATPQVTQCTVLDIKHGLIPKRVRQQFGDLFDQCWVQSRVRFMFKHGSNARDSALVILMAKRQEEDAKKVKGCGSFWATGETFMERRAGRAWGVIRQGAG